MIKGNEDCSKIIGIEFNKTIAMTKTDMEDFESYTEYWICKKEYEEGEVKVKDLDHITGRYRRSAHQDCKINLSLSKKSLLCFIICKPLIHILYFKKLERMISKYMLYQKP